MIWFGVMGVATRTRRVKRTEIGLFRRRATKPRSGRNSAANTASSAARRPGSSVTRRPASPRATWTTSPPTTRAPSPLATPAAAAPSATVCTSALAGSDAGSATVPSLATIDARVRQLRELLDRALDDCQARDAHRGAGLLGGVAVTTTYDVGAVVEGAASLAVVMSAARLSYK